jgi:4-amino-4-deoxy-L-arabinose transferase-like glycosyltransferase
MASSLEQTATEIETAGDRWARNAQDLITQALARMPAPLLRLLDSFAAKENWHIGIVATALSLVAYHWYVSQGLTLAYLDAISHMSIARNVWSSQTPGLAQLGTVWPPLNHIAMLPLIWNSTLFRDGFAGTLPSMLAYVVAAIFMYRTGKLLFSSRTAGWMTALALMLNPSVLYMQSTPMSEMDLICCAVVAVYFVLRWVREFHPADLVKAALATAAGTLVRYDCWALAVALAAVVVLVAWRYHGHVVAEANMWLFSVMAFAGCVAWLLYQQVIFGNPLAFLNGPYSAKAQEQNISATAGLPTYHNPLLALHVYAQAAIDAAGWPVAVAALVGFGLWVFRTCFDLRSLPAYAVLVPFAFNWLSLFLGITIIETPEIPLNGTVTYFNVRYGMMMIPAVALFLAYLASQRRALLATLLLAVTLVGVLSTLQNTAYALQDPLQGANAIGRAQQIAEAQYLVAHYHTGRVLLSGGAFTPMMFYSALPMSTYITEDNGPLFQQALQDPQDSSIQWILVDPGNHNFDAVWAALRTRSDWMRYYTLRQVVGTALLYERTGGTDG